jgi:hypothetical protein
MKLPSLSTVAAASIQTFRRFPVVILNAAVGTGAAWLLIDSTFRDPSGLQARIFLAALMGIPLLTGIAFFAERVRPARSILFQLGGLLPLLAYGWSLPAHVFAAPIASVVRFWLLFFAAHLFVSFAPFTGRGRPQMEFWQYNKTLFIRALISGLFAFVLFIGLLIALMAVNNLFDAEIRPERYGQLFAFVTGIFMTWFFLSGVPRVDAGAAETEEEYPRGLKILTQYVLLPLVVIYLAILYAYTGKIVATWAWPHGWVANLVLGFSITGVFSLLLVFPIRERIESLWIRVFARWFNLALIPLIVLLLVSIWRRVAEYGITENRYIVIIMGLWLAGLVVATLITKGNTIRMIPVSLCVLSILISFGPWGAFAVSERSQRSRLEAIIARYGIRPGETGSKPSAAVSSADAKDASSIVRYLHFTHGIDALQPLFTRDLHTVVADTSTDPSRDDRRAGDVAILDLLEIPYVDEWRPTGSYLLFMSAARQPVDVAGYSLIYKTLMFVPSDTTRKAGKDSTALVAYLTDKGTTLVVGQSRATARRIPLGPLVTNLLNNYSSQGRMRDIPVEKMTLLDESPGLRIRVDIMDIRLQREGDGAPVQSLTADVLLGFPLP